MPSCKAHMQQTVILRLQRHSRLHPCSGECLLSPAPLKPLFHRNMSSSTQFIVAAHTCSVFMLMSVLTSIVMSMFIMVGLTAMVGLLYGEGDVTPSSSSPIRLVRMQALPAVPVCPWALRGWKQFLQEPGFHTCSANSPHADILMQTSTSRLIGLYCRPEPAETGRP